MSEMSTSIALRTLGAGKGSTTPLPASLCSPAACHSPADCTDYWYYECGLTVQPVCAPHDNDAGVNLGARAALKGRHRLEGTSRRYNKTAIFCASILSFFAFPPWIAFI